MKSHLGSDLAALLLIILWVAPLIFGVYTAFRFLLQLRAKDRVALALSVLVPAMTATGLVWLAVGRFQNYGYALFLGLPVYAGVLSVVIYSARQARSHWEALGVASLTLFVIGVCVLGVGLDGLVCVLMAAPLALGLAMGGAWVANLAMQSRHRMRNAGPLLLFCAALPFLIPFEANQHLPAPASVVTSSIDIAAPAATVWKFIPAIPPIPGPPEAILRTGVAYPLSSEMLGSGVGARRFCILSTGPMSEVITQWQPARLLRFAVITVPPSMTETSIYPHLQTPHFEKVMVPEWGEFRLIPLDATHTRLVGTSRYHNRMWPSQYWLPISDFIVHRIHVRVFDFVKAEAERAAGSRETEKRLAGAVKP